MFGAQTDPEDLTAKLVDIVYADEDILRILRCLQETGLPDAWLTSGAVYGTVWNVLTDQPRRHGIKDYDLIYFDNSDLSWGGEDIQIQRVTHAMNPLDLPIELRNQARVHLWFESRFGTTYPQLSCATESLKYYAAKTHSVAVRLVDDKVEVSAPFGLKYIFDMQLVPNPIINNKATFLEKSSRAKTHWPELTVIPWD